MTTGRDPRRDDAALRESERAIRAVVDGLAAHIAIVDEGGRILFVNARWRDFAVQNGAESAAVGEGANYLAVCDAAASGGSAEGAAEAAGIRDVLARRRHEYCAEYPCHSSNEERWFMLRASPFSGDGPPRAIIAHENITARVLAERAARAKDALLLAAERRVQEITDSLAEALFALDRDWRFTFANSGCEKLAGRRRDEMLGRTLWEAAPLLAGNSWEAPYRYAMSERVPFVAEGLSPLLGRWLEARIFPSGDGVAVFLIDIHERKLAEQRLAESERREREGAAELAALLDAVPTPVLIAHDPDCLRVTGNRAADDLLRKPSGVEQSSGDPDALRPRHYRVIEGGRELSAEELPVQHAARGFAVQAVELRLAFDDGSMSDVLVTAKPLQDGDGRPRGSITVFTDITERKQADALLRANRELLNNVINSAPSYIFVTDRSHRYTLVNAAYAKFLGRPAAEVIGRTHHDFYAAEKADQFVLTNEAIMGSGRMQKVEEHVRDAVVVATKFPLLDAQGAVVGVCGVVEDTTERMALERALAQSRERLEQIVGSAMDAIISVDAERRIMVFNTAAEQMFGCVAADAIGSAIDRFIPHRFKAAHGGHVRHFGDTGSTSRAMGRMSPISGLRADGEEFPIEASISRVDFDGGRILTVILRDITERKRLELEVLRVSADEQRRIGQDLHDDVCQWLAGTEFLSASLARNLSEGSPADAALALKICENLREALSRTRGLARGLAPSIIGLEGLPSSLRDLAATSAELFRTRCTYEGPETLQISNQVTALHLYRITQEAISNGVRHGHAREVRVMLRSDAERITLTISDDGDGIDPAAIASPGMGLRTMRFRAAAIGAALEVHPGARGGTEVRCDLPRAL